MSKLIGATTVRITTVKLTTVNLLVRMDAPNSANAFERVQVIILDGINGFIQSQLMLSKDLMILLTRSYIRLPMFGHGFTLKP